MATDRRRSPDVTGNVQAPVGSLTHGLEQASRLLASQPALAEREAEKILKALPNDPRALLVLGAARRRGGHLAAARTVLEPLARAQPRAAHVHYELGLVLARLGEADLAIASLRRAAALRPDMAKAWRDLGDVLTSAGDEAGAERAFAQYLRASMKDPRFKAAADALCEDRPATAQRLLAEHLKAFPTDVVALRMSAEACARLGRLDEAEELLSRGLELSPDIIAARYAYAVVLYRQQKASDALTQVELLLAHAPAEPSYRNLMAACLVLVGEHARAIELYEALLRDQPNQPKIWLAYGHALRATGRRDEGVAAYNRCVSISPGFGEAYWSVANLKTVGFSHKEEGAMRAQLGRTDLRVEDRLHLHYALGKARENAGDYGASFEHYAKGARLRRDQIGYDAQATTIQMRRSKALFDRKFFAERAGAGSRAAAPIFVVGLPRSGSTLIEQILASHSAVEGVGELPDLIAIARTLGMRGGDSGPGSYPEAMAALTIDVRAALGDRYVEATRIHRKLGRAFFVDKMPNNFHHIGLIQLILPKAKIIDARRHPLGGGFSAFEQLFARGHAFSYDLADIGLYYRDYVELMAHFDEVLPGRVHRVLYEDLVEDIEGQVRLLLDYCDLPFEAACLRFHENDRVVRTASSEQVRQPIFRDGLEHWQRYEPWLGPLKDALGLSLQSWAGARGDDLTGLV